MRRKYIFDCLAIQLCYSLSFFLFLLFVPLLPLELVDLPLVKFDFSCNKVLVIPVCFREMKQLQVLLLENNPLQSPPAQVRDRRGRAGCAEQGQPLKRGPLGASEGSRLSPATPSPPTSVGFTLLSTVVPVAADYFVT